jgi:hypothetical protein
MFGRGGVMAPTRGQLDQAVMDGQMLDAITPRPTPRVMVGGCTT